jgi:UDPglucose--hexose-1-phosphate uridylyltransferase
MSRHGSPALDTRVDSDLGTVVHVVRSRQSRPNLPSRGCPFCVGGLEASEPYDVKAFPNRWPALGEDRCEVVLYTPDHDATMWSIGPSGVRRVIDLWAERTVALRAIGEVDYVLVFENRGADVGATIPHPHGQIYAFDHVPSRPRRLLEAGWRPDPEPGDRLVIDHRGWRVWTQHAPVHPISITVASTTQLPDLVAASDEQRDGLAQTLVDLFARLDRLYDQPLPYMMWLYQAPTRWRGDVSPWFNIEIVSPWRAPGVQRFIAAAELAGEEYFNPVDPSDVADRLRACSRASTLT